MPIQITCPSCHKALKAPDALAGKTAKCPACGTLIAVPNPAEEILDAEVAEPAPGPAPSGSPIADMLGEEEEFKIQNPYSAPGPPPEQRRPCPACGEMIPYAAAKCRFCGEIFDPTLKRAAQKSDPGADMSTGDWVVAILCSGIGCIAGIIWMIQGKPKGGKMLLVSIISSVVWGAIRVAIESAARHH